MSRMWIPQSFEVLEQWWNTIVDESSDSLNDWESKFMESIGIRIANRWKITQAQEEALERIYADKTR